MKRRIDEERGKIAERQEQERAERRSEEEERKKKKEEADDEESKRFWENLECDYAKQAEDDEESRQFWENLTAEPEATETVEKAPDERRSDKRNLDHVGKEPETRPETAGATGSEGTDQQESRQDSDDSKRKLTESEEKRISESR